MWQFFELGIYTIDNVQHSFYKYMIPFWTISVGQQ
jgi:hypothetical protein